MRGCSTAYSFRFFPWFLSVAFCLGSTSLDAQSADELPLEPVIAPASDEADVGLRMIRAEDDLQGTLVAAEPLLANPVAFHVDSKGRVFVCESYRQNKGVTDNRQHDEAWLDDDLAAQTVEDRRAYHLKHLGEQAVTYMQQDDRIRLLLDRDGDGKFDDAHVFADHFNAIEEGTGADVLEHKGDVYYTCIPNLWVLRDEDGDFRADERKVLHTGYGVRVAFRGHDLHGLRIGPDGRLYFSIGDRGVNITTPDGKFVNPESGSVFRCELDGSKLEMIHTGLRNPQNLAFDDFGNLFTADNNSDSGDRARWTQILEGGETGWRMSYQYLPDRGPFNREKIWHPYHEGQPAYIVPPIANLSDGPSGLEYYPGTGFSDDYRGRFFLVDFRGTASQSGVRSFRVEPQGAFFRVTDETQPLWGVLATDIQFAPDGGLYLSDWVEGWNGEGMGRLYRFISKSKSHDPIIGQVKEQLAADFSKYSPTQLQPLLNSPDQRVRLKAQWELASQGSQESLQHAALSGPSLLARLHGTWGLGQIARKKSDTHESIRATYQKLLGDSEPEVRVHAAHGLGDIAGTPAQWLRPLLADDSARVRYAALMSLGKLKDHEALQAVISLTEENNNRDPILRHGAVMAMSQMASDTELAALSKHGSPAVRLAVTVALRRQASAQVARFLDDADPLIVREAATSIHDLPIEAALPDLAKLLEKPELEDATLRRALNANLRLGLPENAVRLANYAAREQAPEAMRREALILLGQWAKPQPRDRVLGMWRPIARRDSQPAAVALRPHLKELSNSTSAIQLEVARMAGALGLPEASPLLARLARDDDYNPSQRAEAIEALARLAAESHVETLTAAVSDRHLEVRTAALAALAHHLPKLATPHLLKAAQNGEVTEQQTAIEGLGAVSSPEAIDMLALLMQQLVKNELAPELHLETLTAASSKADPRLAQLVKQYQDSLDPSNPADAYRESMFGGNADRGRTIFLERSSVSCLRCHRVRDQGGLVGPELTQIGASKDRRYLMESIVTPDRAIAKGFESAIIINDEGQIFTGIVRNESETQLTLMDSAGNQTTIDKATIEEREVGRSAMPEDLMKKLTKAELRDLVEFLSQLK